MTDPSAHLIPRPRELRLDGSPVAGALPPEAATTGTDAASEAWRLLADLEPGTLPAEGYALRIEAVSAGPRVIVAAADEQGLLHAKATLRQLVAAFAQNDEVTPLTIRDWPAMTPRGVVEGFYGGPWSHQTRLDFFRFAGSVKLNSFIYAPKDEPYHRDRWRDLYPQDQLERIGELAVAAHAAGVRFVYSLAPGLSMRFSEDAEHAALAAKCAQLWDAGVRSFALLFDDVPNELSAADDVARFGAGQAGTGAAHGETCARFVRDFLAPHGIDEPLMVCPTDYAGCSSSPYRDALAATIPEDALILWTGSDIVVGEVTRTDVDQARASYRRDLVLWDNFPVNDFDRTRLFLGPLQGRTTDVAGSGLAGLAANPMVEAAPSRFALASSADWAWNPEGYDPADSARRALDFVAGPRAFELAALVSACSSWPPSAPQSPEIESLIELALDGDGDALRMLESEFGLLEATGGDDFDPNVEELSALSRELAPWIAAARDAGHAGTVACRLLGRVREAEASGAEADFDADRQELLAARAASELHYPNILRGILPDFLRAVLQRAGLSQPVPVGARQITVLIGPNPAPGDRELSERLIARGYDVTLTSRVETPQTLADSDLVVITRNCSVEAARAAIAIAIPVLVWGHLEALGLATSSAVTLTRDTVEIIDPEHPLAAGLTGPVKVYRGTGKVTWGEPSPDGQIIARGADPRHPVIVHYPEGAALPGGTIAPAPRLSTFLGSEGLAPWLMSADGYALVTAAVDFLSARRMADTVL